MAEKQNYTYILRCGDGTLYTGWTNDIAKRLLDHRSGKGARYTKGRGPLCLVHLERFDTKSEALRREAQIKSLSRPEKEELIRDESWRQSLEDWGLSDLEIEKKE